MGARQEKKLVEKREIPNLLTNLHEIFGPNVIKQFFLIFPGIFFSKNLL